MSLQAYIQDHMNDDIHTAVVVTTADKFFVGNGFKSCSKCKEVKPRDYFADRKDRPSGKKPRCRTCINTYYTEHKERVDKRHRDYVSDPKGRDEYRQRLKRYHARRFFYFHVPRSTRRKVTKYASPQDLWSLWKKQRGTCPLTGIRLTRDNSELDHIVPWKSGGSSTKENLRWVYGPVNRMKHHLSDAEFFELCRLVATRHPVSDLLTEQRKGE